jgi:Zn-dependent protease with chaperone function
MDFYSHQENARRRSRGLLVRFLFANVLLIALLTACLTLLPSLAGYLRDANSRDPTVKPLAIAKELLPFALQVDLCVFGAVLIAAAIRFYFLSSTGGAVAEALGGTLLPQDTDDHLERRYLNVVEEMAIAANVTVPQVYILADEPGINAFASGPTPEKSAVAVTRGALERLTRDELQGVVAHEFSHILHGDVRLNIRIASYIYGLAVLYAIGRFFFESQSNHRKSRSAGFVIVLGLVFLLVGFLGRLVSVLMSAAISRQREFLADATAVQLTRNPDGIAGALKKIGGFSESSQIHNSKADSMSHFFLAKSDKPSLLNRVSATHPPLGERISRLDPSFKGDYPESSSIPLQNGDEQYVASMLQGSGATPAQTTRAASSPPHFRNEAWLPPAQLHPQFVGPGCAESAVLALLLSQDETTRKKQSRAIEQCLSLDEVERKEELFAPLSLNQRLSVMMMAMPSMQAEGKSFRTTFSRTVMQMVRADGQVSLLEFLIGTLVQFSARERDPSFKLRGNSSQDTLKSAVPYLENVLSVCASFASGDSDTCRLLVGQAAASLREPCVFKPSARNDISFFILSLEKLRSLSPKARARIMQGFEVMVHSDGEVTELELALMRTFSMLLRTALPHSLQA